MKKIDITDYDIRIWGSTTIISDHKKVDYIVDEELDHIGLQHNGLDNNQEKKLIELLDKVVKDIREVEKYLIEVKK